MVAGKRTCRAGLLVLFGLAVALVLVLVQVVLARNASAQAAPPQETVADCEGERTYGIVYGSSLRVAATFVAGKDITITRAQTFLRSDVDVRMDIRATDPQTGAPTDEVLGSATIPASQIPDLDSGSTA